MKKTFSNIKKVMIAISGAVIIASSYSFFPEINNEKINILETKSTEKTKTFVYSIPSNWKEMTSGELKSYKDAYVQSGSQKVKDYSGESFSTKINLIEGIQSIDKKVKVILLEMYIPHNSSTYIKDMYEESKQKFKWGLDNGQLSKINENKLTTFKNRDCYLNDFVLSSGMRMITYLMQADSIKENVYQIGIFIEPEELRENYQRDLDIVIESLIISNN